MTTAILKIPKTDIKHLISSILRANNVQPALLQIGFWHAASIAHSQWLSRDRFERSPDIYDAPLSAGFWSELRCFGYIAKDLLGTVVGLV